MRLSGGDLQRFMKQPAPLKPPVEPRLFLIEEVALLSLGCSRIRAHHTARIAAQAHPEGPCDYHAALTSLAGRGMLTRTGPLRTPVASPAAQVPARKARVGSTIRRPAPPEGVDAELLVLLAAARALELPGTDDHMSAHARVASIGHNGTIPAAVTALAVELGTETMMELADRLLPARREDLSNADFAGRSNLSATLAYGPGAWC
jgi:hypothetical protein